MSKTRKKTIHNYAKARPRILLYKQYQGEDQQYFFYLLVKTKIKISCISILRPNLNIHEQDQDQDCPSLGLDHALLLTFIFLYLDNEFFSTWIIVLRNLPFIEISYSQIFYHIWFIILVIRLQQKALIEIKKSKNNGNIFSKYLLEIRIIKIK